jgi:hypothetical protein
MPMSEASNSTRHSNNSASANSQYKRAQKTLRNNIKRRTQTLSINDNDENENNGDNDENDYSPLPTKRISANRKYNQVPLDSDIENIPETPVDDKIKDPDWGNTPLHVKKRTSLRPSV